MLSIVKNVDSTHKKDWKNYLHNKDATTFADDPRWLDLIDEHYGFPQYRSFVRDGANVRGSLALTLTDHPLFGRYLATAPFANYGGFHYDNNNARDSLVAFAENISEELNVKYVVLRHNHNDMDLPDRWKMNNIYATYVIHLNKEPDHFFQHSIKNNARRQVKKAFREGLKIKFGTFNLLDDFWNIITRSMKELGSPYHSKNYLLKLLDIWGEDAKIGIVYTKEDHPYGCCLLMFHKDTAVLLHANILYHMRAVGGGDFLYWSFISECCKRGFSQLDLGRSLIGSGNERFKMKWNPTVYPLNYWYYLHKAKSVPNLNQSNSLYNVPRKIWSGLPLVIQRKFGPHLISGIL